MWKLPWRGNTGYFWTLFQGQLIFSKKSREASRRKIFESKNIVEINRREIKSCLFHLTSKIGIYEFSIEKLRTANINFHSFFQPKYAECLQCARDCSRLWKFIKEQRKNKIPALIISLKKKKIGNYTWKGGRIIMVRGTGFELRSASYWVCHLR